MLVLAFWTGMSWWLCLFASFCGIVALGFAIILILLVLMYWIRAGENRRNVPRDPPPPSKPMWYVEAVKVMLNSSDMPVCSEIVQPKQLLLTVLKLYLMLSRRFSRTFPPKSVTKIAIRARQILVKVRDDDPARRLHAKEI